MGETCDVCGRPKCSATGGPCEWDGRECHGGVDCYSRGYERSQEALAAARRESTLYRGVIGNLLNVMEMQEKRESGAFHITGEVMWGIWSDAKFQASEALAAPGAAAGEEGK